MSAKLTKYSREAIAKRAVAHAFDPREAALDVIEDALAREAYATLFTQIELKAVSKVPENWIRRDACLRFNVGGRDIRLEVLGGGLPVPYRPAGTGDDYGGYSCNRLGAIPFGDLCDRILAHASAAETLREERRAALRATITMLDGVTTMGKLAEAWPEGKAFYADFTDAAPVQLPALRVGEINALLGLAEAA